MEYKVLTLTTQEMQMTVHPTLVFTNKELVLCDTGNKNQLPLIEEELNKYGFTIKDITKVVITHHDHDHIG
jgi:glyoxylase-like metal-dependent hydrolase (beta-lactamase superfamily II)